MTYFWSCNVRESQTQDPPSFKDAALFYSLMELLFDLICLLWVCTVVFILYHRWNNCAVSPSSKPPQPPRLAAGLHTRLWFGIRPGLPVSLQWAQQQVETLWTLLQVEEKIKLWTSSTCQWLTEHVSTQVRKIKLHSQRAQSSQNKNKWQQLTSAETSVHSDIHPSPGDWFIKRFTLHLTSLFLVTKNPLFTTSTSIQHKVYSMQWYTHKYTHPFLLL